MVKITVRWRSQFQSTEADVVKSFVIDTEGLVCIFYQLVDWEGGVVRFNHGIGYFGRWHHTECGHDSIWILFSDFWNK